jgi:hypothetical protein
VSAPHALQRQSCCDRRGQCHDSGWGLGHYEGGRPHVVRSALPAGGDPRFAERAAAVASDTLLAHVRKASAGSVAERNWHPFAHGRWLFAHNGTLTGFADDPGRLRALLPAPLRAAVREETDSEHAFQPGRASAGHGQPGPHGAAVGPGERPPPPARSAATRRAGAGRGVQPGGNRLLTCIGDNTARVWGAATGAPLLPPLRHFGSVEAGRFSADGKRLATASADNTGRVWDAATGEPLTTALSHRGWGRVTDVGFSPAGDRPVTAGADGTVQVWPLGRNDWPPEDLERLAELLGGSRIGADAGSLVPLDVGSLRRLWDELRTRRPEPVGPAP